MKILDLMPLMSLLALVAMMVVSGCDDPIVGPMIEPIVDEVIDGDTTPPDTTPPEPIETVVAIPEEPDPIVGTPDWAIETPQHLQRPTVRIVYLRPKDRTPQWNHVQEFRQNIGEAQAFYADEMERNGFGRKTFTLDLGADGLPLVHHVEMQNNEDYYRRGGPRNTPGVIRAGTEYSRELYPEEAHHVRIFIMDMTREALSGSAGCAVGFTTDDGLGGPITGGGVVFVAGICGSGVPLVAHELGHAFGLHHDFRDGIHSNRLMAYGSQSELHPDAADWLSVNVFFTGETLNGNTRGTFTILPDYEHTQEGMQIRFQVEDSDGLHRVQLGIYEPNGAALIDHIKLDGGTAQTLTLVSPKLTKNLPKYTFRVRVIDKKGGMFIRIPDLPF